VGAVFGATRGRSTAVRAGAVGIALLLIDGARSRGLGGEPWLLLGHTQAGVPGLAQLAVLGGVPLVSVLLGALNAALAEAVARSRAARRPAGTHPAAALLGAAGAAGLLGLPLAQAFHPEPAGDAPRGARLLLVQPAIPVEERWVPEVQRTNLAIQVRLTQRELARGAVAPDLILWPETALTSPLDQDAELRAALGRHAASLPAPLVLGVVRAAASGRANRYTNAAVWLGPQGEIAAAVGKTRGVPIVEAGGDFPGAGLLRRLLGQPAAARRLEEAPAQAPLRAAGTSLAVVFCYEVVYPGLVARRREPDTAAIVNLANDSWFPGETVSRQQIAFGSFRAIEQRLPLLRVAQGGVSAVVDRFGRVRETLPFGAEGSLRAVVAPGAPPGPGERLAFAGLLAAGALVGLCADRTIRRRWWP